MNVALEGEVLYIEWISPAVNIVGFEHKPSSHEQEETVRQALETLRDGQRLFSPTPEAGCRLAEAGVETDILAGESGHSHETHEHDKADHEAGEHHAAEGEAHAEFHATYRFACEQPGRLRELDVQVFSLFPGTEALEAQAVSERGQTAVDLSPSSTRLGF